MSATLARNLLAVTLVAAIGASLLLATHVLTRARIAAQEHEAELAALSAVLPPDHYDNDPMSDRISVTDAATFGSPQAMPVLRARWHGAPSALVLEAVAPNGYAGPIRLVIGVAADGTVLGVRVLEHHETPGLGDAIEAAKSHWIEQFRGKSLTAPGVDHWAVKRDGGDFDQMSGATVTPRAVIAAVRRVLEYAQAHQSELYAPAH